MKAPLNPRRVAGFRFPARFPDSQTFTLLSLPGFSQWLAYSPSKSPTWLQWRDRARFSQASLRRITFTMFSNLLVF